jgi:hypothetical protein
MIFFGLEFTSDGPELSNEEIEDLFAKLEREFAELQQPPSR